VGSEVFRGYHSRWVLGPLSGVCAAQRERKAREPRGEKWAYTPEFKARAVAAVRELRRCEGVQLGDITRVAAQLGVERANLYRWVGQAIT
jgi:transposase-like protein